MDYFSARNKLSGYKPVLEDAPQWLRIAFRDQFLEWIWERFDAKRIYRLFCLIGRVSAAYSGSDEQFYGTLLADLITKCAWYSFYDFVELVGRELRAAIPADFAVYQADINMLFENGQVGWRLDVGSNLVPAIPAAISERMQDVGDSLMKHFAPAAEHYQKAIKFIYGRPSDPENGIKEIVSAVESIGRVIYPFASTLGDVVKAMRGEQTFPPMLLTMIEKFYGYANSEPAVRHGGSVPSRVMRADSELSLTVGIGLIQYLLSAKRPDVFLADITDSSDTQEKN